MTGWGTGKLETYEELLTSRDYWRLRATQAESRIACALRTMGVSWSDAERIAFTKMGTCSAPARRIDIESTG